MYNRDGTMQIFNKKITYDLGIRLENCTYLNKKISFIHSIWKKLSFAFRQRKLFNEDSEFLLTK
jgi:hypothetical protein